MGLLRATVRSVVEHSRNATGVVTASAVEDSHASPLHDVPKFVLVILALLCLCLAACASGMTLGYMSLDTIGLEIVSNGSNVSEAAAAAVILPVRKQGNLLLCTLLLTNTLATELLPLVLEALYPGGLFALITSVLSLIIFSEIIPQSVCSRHALEIGAYMIDVVKVLRIIFYPVAAPIAYLLDLMLGQELGTVYDRDGLKGLIDVHSRNKYGVLTQDETEIMKGTLDFSLKTVKDALTRAEDVFMLDVETRLTRTTVLEMLRRGHSRIPLYESDRNNIVCLLLLKQLVLVDVDDQLPIRALINNKKRAHKIRVAPALHCLPGTSLVVLLREFQRGRSHMAIVYDKLDGPEENRTVVGIVTIEDLMEELIGNINDETDVYISNESKDPVLVRGTDGKLVRVTKSRLPGTNTIVMKEIDVKSLKRPLIDELRGRKIVVAPNNHSSYGSISQSSGQLPSIDETQIARRPRALPVDSFDDDDYVEDLADRDSQDLLRVRNRQHSYQDDGSNAADEASISLKWKQWQGTRSPAVPGSASSSSSRPSHHMSLDIARFHETLAETDDEKDPIQKGV